jgi:Predicted 3'-5' exonuclease related to the exonuclease domain of PolB
MRTRPTKQVRRHGKHDQRDPAMLTAQSADQPSYAISNASKPLECRQCPEFRALQRSAQIYVIASDGGLLAAPVAVTKLTISPAERFEPGKPGDIDGGEVERYFREGRIREIAEYCESDVVNTYRVWLRHELFRGRLTDAAFLLSEWRLAEFIKARGNTKPHLTELMS